MQVDADYNVIGFEEKPEVPKPMPGDPTRCLVSMGNYLFSRDLLNYCFQEDAKKKYVSKDKLKALLEVDDNAMDKYSTHDIGYDIIPFLHRTGLRISVYDFGKNKVPGVSGQEIGYWRDVGTLDELYDANMDICGINPIFNLYNDEWPIHAHSGSLAPAKFSLSSEIYNSVVAEGCIITRSRVIN
jgi:glucose-1-phosphate adenylyltransferase